MSASGNEPYRPYPSNVDGTQLLPVLDHDQPRHQRQPTLHGYAMSSAGRPAAVYAGSRGAARSPRHLWLGAAGLALLIVMVLGVTFLGGRSEGEGSGNKLAVKPAAPFSRVWESDKEVSARHAAALRDVHVAVECEKAQGPDEDETCVLRAREVSTGRERWVAPYEVSQMTIVEAIGGSVVVHDGDLDGAAILTAAGAEIKKLPDYELVGFSTKVAVFMDAFGGHMVAVEVSDGRQVWEKAVDEQSEIDISFDTGLPAGIGNTYLTEAPSPWVPVPGENQTSIVEVDTGMEIGVVANSAASVFVVDDKIVTHDVDGGKLSGFNRDDLSKPTWETKLGENETASACVRLVCVFDLKNFRGRVLAPTDGRVITKNDKGLVFGAREGERVLTLHCAEKGSAMALCPNDGARWRILAFATGEKLWESDSGPVFTVLPGQGGGQLIVSEAASGDATRVSVFSAGSSDGGVSHAMKTKGLDRVPDEYVAQLNSRHYPGLSCLPADTVLLCRSPQVPGKLMAWRLPA